VSHIVQIQTQVRDATAVAAACTRLGLPPPAERTVRLFRESVRGLAVELSGWLYPVVCDLAAGTLRFDNYGGQWGKQQELDRFLQAYAIEKSRLEARRHGHAVTEQVLADGSIKLSIHVGGAA
jgi:hypothetical protein